MNGEVTVQVEELTKSFGDFTAVDRVSFEIKSGEIWGFLGPNGAGKSTTIRMLCGVLAPSSGRAEVLGYDVARNPDAVKLRIGYMSQGSSLWSDLTVEEHLRFTAGLFGLWGAKLDDAVEQWMRRLSLADRRTTLAAALPGGFRKRLALACALVHRPMMLFLDEPTSGVDPVSRREFWDLIVELADGGTTIMVTTHYLDEAEHCNQLAFIYGGKIVGRGSPEALKHSESIGITAEIVASDNVTLLDKLDALPYVKNATLYGSTLHATVSGAQDFQLLQTFVRQEDPSAASPAVITASLEDVFASLVHAP